MQLKERASQRIVDIALELFSRFGYDSVSTTQIAKAAEISQPNIHYHFKTKDALWKAAIAELARRVETSNAQSLSGLVADKEDPYATLRESCLTFHRLSVDVPELGAILSLEGLAGGERLDWLVQTVFRESYDAMLQCIQECIDAELIKPMKPHQILLVLTGAAVTYYNLAPLVRSAFGAEPNDRQERAAFVSAYMDVVFDGLKLRESSS